MEGKLKAEGMVRTVIKKGAEEHDKREK